MDERAPDRTTDTGQTPALSPLTAQAAALRVGVNERTIRRAIARGELTAAKHAGIFHIALPDLERYQRAHRRPARRPPSRRASRRKLATMTFPQHPEEITPEAASQRLQVVPFIGRRPHGLADLPRPLTSLVGREREAAEVRALLGREDVRLVTLTGPGGVGKTRLALQTLTGPRDTFTDELAFVPLAAIADPELVAPAIFHVLGGREPGNDFTVDRLHRLLHDRRILLVLDNFEHLMPAAAMVAGLLAATPGMKCLVTSRGPLRLSFEQEYVVPPLSLPEERDQPHPDDLLRSDAVRLFIQRAQATRPGFRLTDDNAPAVRSICRRLDGLPLAIELAAARLNHLSPGVLRDRLEQPAAARLPLLTGGPRDLPARHQTMRQTIAWSYDLLDRVERAHLQHLGVFVGGFSAGAAAAVCDLPEPAMLDAIRALADKSLIDYAGDHAGEPRYGMLEMIREFSLEQLAAGDQETTARRRHAEWCLAFAEQTGRQAKGPAVWLERLDREHANLRLALAWYRDQGDAAGLLRLAGALAPFWEERCHYDEGRRWLETALADDAATRDEDRLRAVTGAGTLAWLQNDFTHAMLRHEEALNLALRLGDREAEAFALNNIGVQAMELTDFDHAVVRYEACLAIADEAGMSRLRMYALFNLGQIHRLRFAAAAAARCMEQALALGRQLGEDWIAPNALTGLGMAAFDQADHGRSADLLREALAAGIARGNLSAVADSIDGLARTRAVAGEASAAARLFGAAEALREAAGSPLSPIEGAYCGPVRDAVREALGPAAFAAAWAAGRLLPPDAAIAEARSPARAPDDGSPVPHRTLSPAARGLTERERQILRLLAGGSSNRELAEQLFISPSTVARHLANIFAKLGVDSRARAIAYALQHELA